MITVTSTSNAPGTTIRVHAIALNLTFADTFFNLNVRLMDNSGGPISLPQPVRGMTSEEKAAFTSLAANAGETLSQFIARAAAPYLSAVYGITYATA